MINDSKIEELVESRGVYQRGCRYFDDGAVQKFVEHSVDYYTAEVSGSDVYRVAIKLNQRNKIQRCSCECPAYYQYDGVCKHIVAVLKKIQSVQLEAETFRHKIPPIDRLFALFQDVAKGDQQMVKELPIKLIPICHLQVSSHRVQACLMFTIGKTRQYVMKNTVEFLKAILYDKPIVYGKEFVLEPDNLLFDEISQKLVDLMVTAYEDERNLTIDYYSSQIAVQRKFNLSPSNLAQFFSIMEQMPFELEVNGKNEKMMQIIEGRPPIKIALQENFGNGMVSLGNHELLNLDQKFQYILYNHQVIYKVDEVFSRYIKPLIQCFEETDHRAGIFIKQQDVPEFFSKIMPELEKIAPVKVDARFLEKFDILPLNTSIYFDHAEEGICAQITFMYGEHELNPALDAEKIKEPTEKRLIRDRAAENQILSAFKQYGFLVEGEDYVQHDEEQSYDFLVEAVPKLVELAEVYYANDFKNKEIKHIDHVTAGIRINDQNILEMSLKQTDFNLSELLEILASYRLKKRYHRLKDGTFIPLESEELETIADFMGQLDWKLGNDKEVVKIPLAKAVYIDSLAREAKGLQLERSTNFKKMVQDIKEPMDVETEIPAEMETILRDYQKTGFKWLTILARYGLGGILADDMGLGKTLQVITFLVAEKERTTMPTLVVTPTSLLYNWVDEVERFAPQLSTCVISGTHPERAAKLAELEGVDIVLTTYNLLKRDIEIYQDLKFKYCFLDEAQHIKNPSTKNAKTVKKLTTCGYFALTGTPIENTLTELWSIFDFLMPGYLLSHQVFKKRFELPIVKNADQRAAKELHRYIAPFILRRLKCDVLKELPDKTESKMINEMTVEQAKIYAGFFVQAQKEFAEELARRGFAQSRIKILSILTRLRQICCHPSLFLEDYRGGSGKLDMLREVIEGAVSSGHRILIFSQFTSMLAIIRQELEKAAISYDYLDGQTPSIERLRLVKAFNHGNSSVFLISLKAGGTGLNLTGADMVIHYDPWWNPAVEEQATDRAYRLGQTKNVQVLKFITKDTIEEKIFALQQKKKGLIDQMIQPGETFVSKLTEEELSDLFRR